MSVRDDDTRASELFLGGRAKSAVLRSIAAGTCTISGIARRSGLSKSAVVAAVRSLAGAGVIAADHHVWRVVAGRESLVEGVLSLDDDAGRSGTSLAAHAGRWVAVDERFDVLASAEAPLDLVADLERRGVVPHGIMRAPVPGERIEGALVG